MNKEIPSKETSKNLPYLLLNKENKNLRTEGNLPRNSGITASNEKPVQVNTDLLLAQIIKQNKDTLDYLKTILSKPSKQPKENKGSENRTLLGDLKDFTIAFKDELVNLAGYMTGANALRKSNKVAKEETPKQPSNMESVATEQVKTDKQNVVAQPSNLQQAIARLQDDNGITKTTIDSIGVQQPKVIEDTGSAIILGNMQSLFKNMLDEVVVIRKFVEGTLSLNTMKGGSKYIERDFQNQKVRHVDYDTAKMGKETDIKPIPTVTESKGIETDVSKDDAYIEKLSTAIANKLSDVLANIGDSFDISATGGGKGGKDAGKGSKKAAGAVGAAGAIEAAGAASTGKAGNFLARLGVVAEGGLSAYDVAQIEQQKEEGKIDTKTANEQQAKSVGRLAGAGTLGTIGLGFGAALGGPLGGLAGGAVGAIAGGFLGGEAAEKLANTIQNLSFFSNDNKNQQIPSITPNILSNGATMKEVSEENIDAKLLQDMMGKMLSPIMSQQVIDNSSNQMLGVAPDLRNSYSPYMRQQLRNMVGDNI